MSGNHTNSHDEHHIMPVSVYMKVIGALLFLTFITVWIGQFDFGFLNTAVAMGIASVKAALVLGYFMHLKYDDKIFRVILAVSVLFLFTLFVFAYGDIVTRIAQTSTL